MGDLKLILPEGGPAELYDLAADPGEARNLAAQRPAVVTELATRLERWAAGGGVEATTDSEPALDAETREALKSLGYID